MKLPRFIATTPPPTVGAARATDIGALTNVGDAQFRAIAGAGRAVSRVAGQGLDALIKRNTLDDQAFAGEAEKRAGDAFKEGSATYEEYDPLANNVDPRDIKNYYDGTKVLAFNTQSKNEFRTLTHKDFMGKIRNLSKGFKTPQAQQSFINRWDVAGWETYGKLGNAKHQESHEVLILGNARDAARNGDMETSEQWMQIAEKNGLVGPEDAAKERSDNAKLAKDTAINDTKPFIEQVLIENDFQMKPANEAIDELVGGLEKEGVLNDVDAADARKDLSNWAADVAAQRRRSKEQDIIQTEKDLSDKLAEGTFTSDDVALANMTEAQRKKWNAVIEGARKPPPTEAKFDGTTAMADTVLDFASGKIGQLEARRSLVKERYQELSITDEQYKFGLSRIENKYPDHVAKSIRGALEQAQSIAKHSGFGPAFVDFLDSGEKKKLVEVNNGLLSWIEQESQDDRFPSGEDIYKKVRELGISVKTPENLKRAIPVEVPEKTDPSYNPTNEAVEAMPSGTMWYDPVTNLWWEKQ